MYSEPKNKISTISLFFKKCIKRNLPQQILISYFQQQIDEYRKVVTDRLVSAGIIEEVGQLDLSI